MNLRILATGDIHIGRRPSRLPEEELSQRASAARMWEAIVQRAIVLGVDAVLLSGDIVDHDNRYYEATGPLERGILELAAAEIPTFAVAGNHDWDVFPRILKQLETPFFHLVGQGGNWQEIFLKKNGENLLRIVGWSFPTKHVHHSPLSSFPVIEAVSVATVGLLHAEVDVLDSRYAPVRLADLQARQLALWVLGHVHGPQFWRPEAGAAVLYPGSPQALDPSETGWHGPWLVEFEGRQLVSCRQLPLALVRYEEQILDLSSADGEEAFETQVQEAVLLALETAAAEESPLQLLLLRLNMQGATPLCGRIEEMIRPLAELERSLAGGPRVRVEKCVNLTRPAIDLEELAQNHDPAGMLARTLLGLERGDETLEPLLAAATSRLQEVYLSSTYANLPKKDAERETAREVLIRQGRQLLETLRTQVTETKG